MPPKKLALSTEQAQTLALDLGRFTHDPLGFVRYAFRWGEKGTVLENWLGPDEWQSQVLTEIGDELARTGKLRTATASGKGIGKSCVVAWLILWGLSTFEHTRGVVTANTDTQLRTKTWPELSKWYYLMIPPLRALFKLEATSIHSTQVGADRTWRIDAIPWSANNVEAFAGLHNQGKRIVVIFDEASAIDPVIWDTSDGIFTDKDTEVLWAAFGNPTKSDGRFAQCWGKLRSLWKTRKIDSRTAAVTDKNELNQIVEIYGLDHDYTRIYVLGEFPKSSSMQFISTTLVEEAMARQPQCWMNEPLIMGVDVARFGDDQSVIAFRRGRDAATIPWVKRRGVNLMDLASEIARLADQEHVDAIFVDGVGMGAGVVDRLRQMQRDVFDVQAGGKAGGLHLDEPIKVKSKRAEMWANMRSWLKGGAIPDDDDLQTDLTGLLYGYDADGNTILERKEDAKKRGVASPDSADALALTFAEPVAAKSDNTAVKQQARQQEQQDHNPYA